LPPSGEIRPEEAGGGLGGWVALAPRPAAGLPRGGCACSAAGSHRSPFGNVLQHEPELLFSRGASASPLLSLFSRERGAAAAQTSRLKPGSFLIVAGERGAQGGWMCRKLWAGGMVAPGLVQSALGCVPFTPGSGKVLCPELWACPVPCLAWSAGAAPLASLPAKSSSEGEKKVLTLKQRTVGFLGSFLGGFNGHLL